MDEQTFTNAVRQYQKLLFHIAYAMLHSEQDCADAVQQALMSAWRSRGKLRNRQAMKAWFTRILINECNALLRKRKRMRLTELRDDLPAPPQADNIRLHNALEELPTTLRLPVVLSYLEGFTIAEISQALHIPEGTVKSRMSQGRKRLGELLSEEDRS